MLVGVAQYDVRTRILDGGKVPSVLLGTTFFKRENDTFAQIGISVVAWLSRRERRGLPSSPFVSIKISSANVLEHNDSQTRASPQARSRYCHSATKLDMLSIQLESGGGCSSTDSISIAWCCLDLTAQVEAAQ